MNVPLRSLFSEMFSLAQDPSGPVLSHWSDGGFNIKVLELIHRDLLVKREEPLRLLPRHFQLDKGTRDRPIWVLDSKKIFSVRSAYRRLKGCGLHSLYANIIWGIKAHLKVRALFWLVVNGAIFTWDNLSTSGWQRLSIYDLCLTDKKSIDHLFLRCSFSSLIWEP